MIIFWRGWGALVLFAPLLWILAAVMILIGIDYHESDADMAAATIYRLCAAGLAVATLNLWMVARYRERVAPGVDGARSRSARLLRTRTYPDMIRTSETLYYDNANAGSGIHAAWL